MSAHLRGLAKERQQAWAAYEVAEGEWREAHAAYHSRPGRRTLSGLLLATAAMIRARLVVEDARLGGRS